MFEQVTVLLSFIYAIALTHLLSSANELVLERRRVKFSGLYALWMASAALILIENWLSFWGLHALKQWTIGEILLQLALAVAQYFTCSLLTIRPKEAETIDMAALYEDRRAIVASAFITLLILAMVMNYLGRDIFFSAQTIQWYSAEIVLLAASVFILLAGWARPRWLQWLGGLGVFAVATVFLVSYTITN